MELAVQVDDPHRETGGDPTFRVLPAVLLESSAPQGTSQLPAIFDGALVLFVRSNKSLRPLLSAHSGKHKHDHGWTIHVAIPSLLPHASGPGLD